MTTCISSTSIVSYFLIEGVDDILSKKINNFFFRHSQLPLSLLIPVPVFNDMSIYEWKSLYWGCDVNPLLFSLTENSSSVLVAFQLDTSYILSNHYNLLWSSILSSYFSTNTRFITSLSFSYH
jgi:hypothetical protein